MTKPAQPDGDFEALLQFLKQSRGLDLTGYKRPSLERRFRRRLVAIGCSTYDDYLDFLEVHPDEYAVLFDTLLINVTEFFRDPPVWSSLRDVGLPLILEGKAEEEPIRIWSAGCATGQEACTIAMVLCEALGPDAYRERVKIYATDVDEEALAVARQATYAARELESVPEALRGTYFDRADERYAFKADLRRTLIFGRNNLVADAPISRLDLLVCRNTLMYLTAETQARIVRNFDFALRPAGVLLLGKSEMLISHRDLFSAVDMKQRIFRKRTTRPAVQPHVAAMPEDDRIEWSDERAARDAALELAPSAVLVVGRTGALAFANLAARSLLGVGTESIGRPFAQLRIARDPTDLLAPLELAASERRQVAVGQVSFRPDGGGERRLDVAVLPLVSEGDEPIGSSIVFEDVSRYADLQTQLEANRRDLETAYEELQSTVDELETTNEELQSANEELQTTNEELQSTNEELETMNEELHSTNEELEAINDELRERTVEINTVNDFLESILTSLDVGVAVLDAAQRVQVWNHGAEELWGLRRDEAIDQHFLGLDIGLQPERLAGALRAVIGGASGKEVAQVETVDRRGRAIVCETTVVPLRSRGAGGAAPGGAIVLMEDHHRDRAEPAAGGAGPDADGGRPASGA
jgi:two-component system CheB/CheR fusion protein